MSGAEAAGMHRDERGEENAPPAELRDGLEQTRSLDAPVRADSKGATVSEAGCVEAYDHDSAPGEA
eukprot:5873361-Pleurochrysis_carterae.AAC.1